MASRASAFDEAASCRRRMSLPTAEIPEAGTVIDQIFEHRRIELLLTHQIDQNAWIEIAAARAHDHPAGWGQSHARVDRFTMRPVSETALRPGRKPRSVRAIFTGRYR